MVQLLWILGISLFISSLCSVLEAVLLSVTHSYVEVLKDQGSKAGHYLHVMKQKIDEPIAAILTLNTIAQSVTISIIPVSLDNCFTIAHICTVIGIGVAFIIFVSTI